MSFRMELEDLPPRYRAQAEMQIAQRKSERCLQKSAQNGQNCKRNEQKRENQVKNGSFCEQSTKQVPESEKRYYREVILPKVACGQIVKVQEQVVFDLLPEKA